MIVAETNNYDPLLEPISMIRSHSMHGSSKCSYTIVLLGQWIIAIGSGLLKNVTIVMLAEPIMCA